MCAQNACISRLIECSRDRAAGRKPEPQQPLMSMKAARDDNTDAGKKDDPMKIAKTVLYTLAVTKDMDFAKTLCRVSSLNLHPARSHDHVCYAHIFTSNTAFLHRVNSSRYGPCGSQ